MKLHIGAGEKYLPGYKHMDAIERSHIDYVGNAGDLSFLEDDSVEEIYACHILEHFKRHEVEGVLLEWNRVLTRNQRGVLRLAVPDFTAIAREYAQNGDLNRVMGLLYGRQDYQYNIHYMAYDFNSLKILLEKTGYSDVSFYNWQTFLPSDYDDYSRAYLPHMDFENGRLMSLNVVATKR